jgi:hypothetical protein
MKKWLFGIVSVLLVNMAFATPVQHNELVDVARVVESHYSLPQGLLETVCYVESNWKNVHGRHGEIGVCQIKPSTAKMTCPECTIKQDLLYFGSRSDKVIDVQIQLYDLGLYDGPIDGIFGRKTDKGVRQYQQNQHLKVDGIVGPKTWFALFGDSKPYQSIIAQLNDPVQNIEYAGMHLRWLADTMDTEDPAILAAAYNGGHGHPIVLYMLRVSHRMDKEKELLSRFSSRNI